MKFMNVVAMLAGKDEFNAKREEMINEAEKYSNEGNQEKFEAAIEDVKEFEEDYEKHIENRANLEALKGSAPAPVLANPQKMNNEVDDDMKYRVQFMNFVTKGTRITNADETTMGSDVSPVIPKTIMDMIIQKIEKSGNILARVRKTNIKGGMSVPTSSVKPVATWTAESGKTDKQKKVLASIDFSYHKLRCVVSMSIVADTQTLEIFERTIASDIAEAMIKAIETAIINGTGTNQPKGILKETNESVSVKAADGIKYEQLLEAEGKLPEGYDSAIWVMSRQTFYQSVLGMLDTTGQPIARVNMGITGKPEAMILGRPVEFSKDVTTFATTAAANTIVGFLFKMDDYIFNTNLAMRVKKYTDEDTDDENTKAIMLADGKVVDKNSLVTLKVVTA